MRTRHLRYCFLVPFPERRAADGDDGWCGYTHPHVFRCCHEYAQRAHRPHSCYGRCPSTPPAWGTCLASFWCQLLAICLVFLCPFWITIPDGLDNAGYSPLGDDRALPTMMRRSGAGGMTAMVDWVATAVGGSSFRLITSLAFLHFVQPRAMFYSASFGNKGADDVRVTEYSLYRLACSPLHSVDLCDLLHLLIMLVLALVALSVAIVPLLLLNPQLSRCCDIVSPPARARAGNLHLWIVQPRCSR
ncbi:hypothetical protein C8R45DRAFT_1027443 [Mycena sanguinolenta]|nr:hypothetical protein C8R45DRAFT_1027443 [Mycena sanguinolenta]